MFTFSFFSLNIKDFYSHSNWVEMGYKLPNSNLIRADTSIGNIAGKEVILYAKEVMCVCGFLCVDFCALS